MAAKERPGIDADIGGPSGGPDERILSAMPLFAHRAAKKKYFLEGLYLVIFFLTLQKKKKNTPELR